ncbi:MAG: hypothetical protein GXP06_07480 [Alphaproteobacteria bacterium]|nr:hypothetical protein [Alphaproteobacteria bacterium]
MAFGLKRVVAAALIVLAACSPKERAETLPVGAFANAAPAALSLRELAWLHPSTDTLKILSSARHECVRPAENPDMQYLVDIGRLAFQSPMLFGGPAARGGLSCESCHQGGRDNPNFFLAGLSGEAGTADVTSALFSKVREDGVFNPVPIPSLVGIAGKATFGTQAPAASLSDFIENAVVDEFQGAPPPPVVVSGLSAYIAHLDETGCVAATTRTITADMRQAQRAIELVGEALARDDVAAADFLLVSAQGQLGQVHERFAGPGLKNQRRALERLSRNVAAIRTNLRAGDDASASLAAVMVGAKTIIGDLEQHRRQSLYDVETLRAALRAAGRNLGP